MFLCIIKVKFAYLPQASVKKQQGGLLSNTLLCRLEELNHCYSSSQPALIQQQCSMLEGYIYCAG